MMINPLNWEYSIFGQAYVFSRGAWLHPSALRVYDSLAFDREGETKDIGAGHM